MKSTSKIFNVIILDESGSMQSIKNSVISGFNEIVQTIKCMEDKFPEQAHYITYLTFNSVAKKMHLLNHSIKKLKQIDAETYQPQASTPLYDAIGSVIEKMKEKLISETDYNVLVTIFTDGEENASKEYNVLAIKSLIEELKEKNWTFTYIGANHDVERAAINISIENRLSFKTNAQDIKCMFEKEANSRAVFCRKIINGEDTKTGYFDEEQVF